jgi:hypothetical protein
MSKREPAILLDDIRTAIGKIQRYVAGLNETAFLADEKTIDAVVRNLEIIGEAAKQLPAECLLRHGYGAPRETTTSDDSLVANCRSKESDRARLCRGGSRDRLEYSANFDAGTAISNRPNRIAAGNLGIEHRRGDSGEASESAREARTLPKQDQ